MKNRIAAWKQHHGITEHTPGLRVIPLAVNLMDVKEAEKLVRSAIEEQKATGFTPALVICDTLARSMVGGDENSAKDMGIFVSHADTIRQQLGGITFLAIHHGGKDAERGMRGSSILPGGLDTALRLTRKDNSMIVELFCEKQKDSEDGWKLHLQAEKLDLPPRPGSLKPRSSLVLTGVEASSVSTGAYTKLSGDAALGLSVLYDTTIAEGATLPATSGFPTTPMRGVTELAWRREFYRRITDRNPS
jgi:AAA domain